MVGHLNKSATPLEAKTDVAIHWGRSQESGAKIFKVQAQK